MIFKNSLLLAAFSAISLILGIIRDRLLAGFVGVGQTLDVYNASFRIPDLALGIMLSFAAASTVVPFLTKDHKDNNKEALSGRFSTLFYFFLIAMIIIALFIIVFLPYFAHLIVPGFTGDQLETFLITTRILMLQPIFLGLSALISCLAQLRNEFIIFGVAPLIYTATIIISIPFFTTYGLPVIILGVTFGALAHLLFQSITLYKAGASILIPKFSFVYLREHLKLSIPRSASQILNQLRILFYTAFATTLGVGVLSSFLFAQKITDAIAQMLAQSVSSASLPQLSQYFEENDFAMHISVVKKYSLILFASAIFISATIYIFADGLVKLLYGETVMNGVIKFYLMAFVISMPMFVGSWFLTTAFNSMKRPQVALMANVLATISSVAACLITREQGIISLAYGVITMSATYFLIILVMYSRNSIQAR